MGSTFPAIDIVTIAVAPLRLEPAMGTHMAHVIMLMFGNASCLCVCGVGVYLRRTGAQFCAIPSSTQYLEKSRCIRDECFIHVEVVCGRDVFGNIK